MAEGSGITTSGEAIALSVSDPSSKDAVFVPFNKSSDDKTTLTKRIKKKMSKKILESLQLEGMNAVNSALMASIMENDNDPSKKINDMKTLLECKKNKEEFKKLMAEKLAAKNDKEQEEKKPATPVPVKKLSLKDKIAQRKAKKVTEGKEKCCICGSDKCECKKVGDKMICTECSKLLEKKKRINEGIERLNKKKTLIESAKKRVLKESTDFSKELEIAKKARMRHRKMNEALVDKSGGLNVTLVGIDFNRYDVMDKNLDVSDRVKIENEFKEFMNSSELKDKKIELRYDEGSDSYVIGVNLNENPDMSVNDAVSAVDGCSAIIFDKMNELGIDTSKIDTNCSIINIVY